MGYVKHPGFLSLEIKQKQFKDFKDVVRSGSLNGGYYPHLDNNVKCRSSILSPVLSQKEEEIVLYWEGKAQHIYGGYKNIKNYFDSMTNVEIIKEAHPSILVNMMAILTENKLTELGIPNYVNITLLANKQSLLPDEAGEPSFLTVFRGHGLRVLGLLDAEKGLSDHNAILLQKKFYF